jgi:hypothetical protein
MATRAERTGVYDRAPGDNAERLGDNMTGAHDETKWALLTTEFWAMVALIAAILIAAAISDSLNDTRAWLLVTIVGTGYIVSRGIAKAGVGHAGDRLRRRG